MLRHQACHQLLWPLCSQTACVCWTVFAVCILLYAILEHAAVTTGDAVVDPSLIPGALYASLLLGLVLPQTSTSRLAFFATTCRRVLLPFQLINFADFLLADIFTSLSRPLADLGIAACAMMSAASEGVGGKLESLGEGS